MANLFQATSQFVDNMARGFARQTVTYQRGGTTVDLLAGRGAIDDEVIETAQGATLEIRGTSYIVTTQDLRDQGLFPPELGDQIEDNGETYDVVDANGLAVWRYSDEDRVAVRIRVARNGN